MDWTTVERNWPAFLDVITQRWPRTRQSDLIEISGNREGFTSYLARQHSLTENEAREEVGRWLEGPLPVDVATDEFHDNESISESARHLPEGEDVYNEDRDFGDDRLKEPPVGRT
jgi:hypothetical protein